MSQVLFCFPGLCVKSFISDFFREGKQINITGRDPYMINPVLLFA